VSGPALFVARGSGRRCAYPPCGVELSPDVRRDARFCSKSHRQAAHRFAREVSRGDRGDASLRLAYFDPPYPGLSHLYKGHPDYAGEVDHAALVSSLPAYDGWALSTSARALGMVVTLLEARQLPYRVASWQKGGRGGETTAPRSSWEPVLYHPARETLGQWPEDSYSGTARPRRTDPGSVIGQKPPGFCSWLFALIGACAGDSFVDVFPGSGGVGRAWSLFVAEDRRDGSRRAGRDGRARIEETRRAPGGDVRAPGGDASRVAGGDA